MQHLIDIILRPTTSNKKRRRFAKELYEKSDYPPVVLDECLDYALRNIISASDFPGFLDNVKTSFTDGLPTFITELEISTLIKINQELIDFYKEEDKALSDRIRQLNENRKMVFEFHDKDSIGFFGEHTKHFRDKKKINYKKERYNFRRMLKSADYLIIYHGTSSVFDEVIEEQGICPPSMTGNENDIISKYKQYLDGHMDKEKFERLKESIEKNRLGSVYFSIARGNIREGMDIFTNGDVKAYMERAVKMWGGNERLYRCIVPTRKLLPDEDAKGAKDFVDSIYLMASAKIKGRQTTDIFRVKGGKVPLYVNRCPSSSRFQELMDSEELLHKEYFRQNPIENIN